MTDAEIRELAFQLCTATGREEMIRAVQALITSANLSKCSLVCRLGVADRLLQERGIRLRVERVLPGAEEEKATDPQA